MKTHYSKKLKKRVTIPDYDDHTGELLEDRYSEYLKAAVSKLRILRERIPNHGGGKVSWPIVGDLQRVSEMLEEIIQFIGK